MCSNPTWKTGGAQGCSEPVEWNIKRTRRRKHDNIQYGTPIKYTIVPLSLVKLCHVFDWINVVFLWILDLCFHLFLYIIFNALAVLYYIYICWTFFSVVPNSGAFYYINQQNYQQPWIPHVRAKWLHYHINYCDGLCIVCVVCLYQTFTF